MKYQVFLLVLFSLFHRVVFSQSCLPEGITFETQGQIDSFQVNYPGCTKIGGSVNVYWSNIYNLNGLNVITSIGGDLSIDAVSHLTNLSGLENLKFIGGSLEIDSNDSLTSLTGIEGLDSVGEYLRIQSNPVLTDMDGFQGLDYLNGSLRILGNDALTSLEGLHNLSFIGGDLQVQANAALADLEGLNNIDSINGDLKLFWSTLTDLSGLESLERINGDLTIIHCDYLTDLNPLGNLTSIGSDLEIEYNEMLSTISGVDNIEAGSIVNLLVYQNFNLTTCDVQSVCDYLANPNGMVSIGSNAPGCNSPEEVEEACGVGIGESSVVGRQSSVVCYPNPASDQVIFEIQIQNQSEVKLLVFNSIGQLFATIIDGPLEKGYHQLKWNAREYPAGIYFYRLIEGSRSSTGKIVKLN